MIDPNTVIRYVELIGDRPNVESVYRLSLLNSSSLEQVKIHPTLRAQLRKLFVEIGILDSASQKVADLNLANEFFLQVDLVQTARDHTWQPRQRRPILYTSPPELIPQKMAAEVDDIRNLLTELISGAQDSILILSPYTTVSALKDILRPLTARPEPRSLNIKVFIANPLSDAKRQITKLKAILPATFSDKLSFYYRADVPNDDESILHAKILIVDGSKGYLGSANFTAQGLQKHFELGIEMSDKQASAAKDLLEHLISKGIFLAV